MDLVVVNVAVAEIKFAKEGGVLEADGTMGLSLESLPSDESPDLY